MKEKFLRAMQVFKQHFSPAKSIRDADEVMTTEEIYDKIFKLTFDKSLKIEEIQEFMEENGFNFDFDLDNFVWPLKLNKNAENA